MKDKNIDKNLRGQSKTSKNANLFLDLYFFPTPNGKKITIMLAECKMDYNLNIINISKGHQFRKKFLSISPNNKIPAIVDYIGPNKTPFSLFESGAILKYLALKTGLFYPKTLEKQAIVDQWLFFQMSYVGPMTGQLFHFFNSEDDYAYQRFLNEVIREYKVLNKHLSKNAYLVGDDYTIADIALWPWLSGLKSYLLESLPHLNRWVALVGSRRNVHIGNNVGMNFVDAFQMEAMMSRFSEKFYDEMVKEMSEK